MPRAPSSSEEPDPLERVRRGLGLRESVRACTHLKRVRELWADAEPVLAAARALTDSLVRGCR